MSKKGVKVFLWGVLFLFAWSSIGMAADYPQRPIRLIIPWSTGGASDVLARAFQPAFEKELGQKLLIENIPAGSTKVGTMELIKAKPDGYTLLFSNECWIGRYYLNVYDAKVWEQMVPIGSIVSEPLAIVEVKSDSPYKTMDDLLKAAKANPGKLSCGNPGVGSPIDLMFNGITQKAGVKIQYVPFAGGGKSKLALLGGHIDFRIGQLAETIDVIRAGKVRPLAVSSSQRLKIIPDVPTLKELGLLSGDLYEQIRGFWGPAKLPANLVNTLAPLIEKATKDPAFIRLAEQFTYTVDYRSPERVKEYMANYEKEFGPRLAELNKK
ncbi:MAG: tripartite tricarboxylate transporter substrate binding protein [Deltaproteobacteria bacterium]|nr:tripartite tricarboxylate transporter substrate binding protein [Deltaproteobacteria bacterium]